MASQWNPASSATDIPTLSFLPPAQARVGIVFPAKLKVGLPFKYRPGEQGPDSVAQREKGARYGKVFSNRACLQGDPIQARRMDDGPENRGAHCFHPPMVDRGGGGGKENVPETSFLHPARWPSP